MHSIKNKFVLDLDTTNLVPADYNPRKINEKSFEILKYSLNKFGIVKPVILNGKNNILTAGHQRTKACKAIGITQVPAIIINQDIPQTDEVRFNLFHNSIESNASKVKIKNVEDLEFGYTIISHEDVIPIHTTNAEVVKEISRLAIKYGEWGSIVVNEEGEVVQNSEYALAMKNLKYNVLVYKMRNEAVEEYLDICNNNEFGEYYYEALGIKAYNQLYCQMNRVAGESQKSTLYEKVVLKDIEKDDRILDFGAGRCGYINMLKDNGYKAFAYEPHYKKDGKPNIDVRSVVGFINNIERDIRRNGLYDKVVLDSVINSVTSLEFEDMVLTTCNSLLSENGTFYCATRNLDSALGRAKETRTRATDKGRYLEFLDKDNFCATFRNGLWTMQRFHSEETLKALLYKYFKEVKVLYKNDTAFQVLCKKPRKLPKEQYEKALNVEFNMEYPGNYRHNRHEKLVETILKNVENR